MDTKQFLWVSNQTKALRAVKELKMKGLEVTEEAIKELYIKYGGYVLTDEEIEVEKELIEEEVAAKPKSRRNVK